MAGWGGEFVGLEGSGEWFESEDALSSAGDIFQVSGKRSSRDEH